MPTKKKSNRQSKLMDLYDQYRTSNKFKHLRQPGYKLVEGEGSYEPRFLVVGEAPGGTENAMGRPFVGASGRLIRKVMTDIEIIDDVFITNVVKYRPPGNRTPTFQEVADSQPFLRKEWRILGRPKVIIAVGGTASFALLKRSSIGQIVGTPQPLSDGATWVYPMYHPAFILRNKNLRSIFISHWNAFSDWVEGNDQL